MNANPEISVVMANRNAAPYLAAAIASLQSQTFRSWELLFADDGSTDDSLALAEGFARADPRIRVFADPASRGPAAARNRALAQAQGRWIAIFDSDDLMRPERLTVLVRHAHQTGARIVADNLLVISTCGQPQRPFLRRRQLARPCWIGFAQFVDSNRLFSRLPDLGYLKPLFSAGLLRERGFFYDESLRIGEDYDLLVRLLAGGEKLRLIPEPLYLYRRHAQSSSWRLTGADVRALIDAHDRFVEATRLWSPAEWRALARRRSSLDTMLRYDRVVAMVKAGDWRAALAAAARAPQIWPLLTRPLRARLARLRLPQRQDAPAPQLARPAGYSPKPVLSSRPK